MKKIFLFKTAYGQILKTAVAVIAAVVMVTGLGGCALFPEEEEEHKVTLVKTDTTMDYELAQVTVGNVVLTQKIYCEYREENGEELSFGQDGRAVEEVYVTKGEEVKKGTLLAKLECDDLISEKNQLQYTIDRNSLLKEQNLETLQFNIDELEKEFAKGWMDSSYYNETVADMEEQTESSNEKYDDAIEVATIRLSEVNSQLSGCYIYAGMDGTVSYIINSLVKGSTSYRAGNTMIRVIDMSHCNFFIDAEEYGDYFDYFTEGQELILTNNSGEECTVTVQAYSEEDGGLFLSISEIDENRSIGDRMYMYLTLDSRENVLTLPKAAVHYAGGQYYVYVSDDGGLKSMRYITAGLVGDDSIEILDGLKEGDIVIKK